MEKMTEQLKEAREYARRGYYRDGQLCAIPSAKLYALVRLTEELLKSPLEKETH